MRLRLRQIFQDADFRQNELTLWRHYKKKCAFEPKAGDAVLLVSRSGNQLLFVLNYSEGVAQKSTRERIESLRFRLSGGYWNPLMIANYAAEVGIELEGIKRFEEAFK